MLFNIFVPQDRLTVIDIPLFHLTGLEAVMEHEPWHLRVWPASIRDVLLSSKTVHWAVIVKLIGRNVAVR